MLNYPCDGEPEFTNGLGSFPKVDVEVGNELCWYIFAGEPFLGTGYIYLDEKHSRPRLTA